MSQMTNPMFSIRLIWVIQLYSYNIDEPPKSKTIFVIPQLCRVYPMRLSTYKSITYIPSLLTYMRTLDSEKELVSLCTQPDIAIDYMMLLEAFTTKDICTFYNYDLLEIFGDTAVK